MFNSELDVVFSDTSSCRLGLGGGAKKDGGGGASNRWHVAMSMRGKRWWKVVGLGGRRHALPPKADGGQGRTRETA